MDEDNSVFVALLVLGCIGGVSWLAILAWLATR